MPFAAGDLPDRSDWSKAEECQQRVGQAQLSAIRPNWPIRLFSRGGLFYYAVKGISLGNFAG